MQNNQINWEKSVLRGRGRKGGRKGKKKEKERKKMGKGGAAKEVWRRKERDEGPVGFLENPMHTSTAALGHKTRPKRKENKKKIRKSRKGRSMESFYSMTRARGYVEDSYDMTLMRHVAES